MKHLQLYEAFNTLPNEVRRVDLSGLKEFLGAGSRSSKPDIDKTFTKSEKDYIAGISKITRKAVSGLSHEILLSPTTRVLFRKNLAAPDGFIYGLSVITADPAERTSYLSKTLRPLSLIVAELAAPEIDWAEIK